MKWTMDALLPADKRYTSLKFRRVAPKLFVNRLDFDDAAELVAFVETVGMKPARWIFHWEPFDLAKVKKLVEHMLQFPVVTAMIEENRLAPVTREQGLAVLQAMRDGGWKQSNYPPIVRLAALDMRDEGMSMPAVGRAMGLTLDQVRVLCCGIRTPRCRVPAGALWAL